MAKEAGMIEAIQLWGRTCGRQGACDICPVGAIRGANVTCQEFAEKFPEKFLSILQEMDADEGTYSYYSEFCLRFPECQHPIENVAKIACRRAIFEGDVNCPYGDDGDCIACWNAPYEGDVSTPVNNRATNPNRKPTASGVDFDEDEAIKALLGN